MTSGDLSSTNHAKLIKTAKKSPCRYQVAAIILDSHGDIISAGYNKPRLMKRGGGLHAEVDAVNKGGSHGDYLILLRIGRKGHILPIHPCSACSKLLGKLGSR